MWVSVECELVRVYMECGYSKHVCKLTGRNAVFGESELVMRLLRCPAVSHERYMFFVSKNEALGSACQSDSLPQAFPRIRTGLWHPMTT